MPGILQVLALMSWQMPQSQQNGTTGHPTCLSDLPASWKEGMANEYEAGWTIYSHGLEVKGARGLRRM